MKKKLNEMINKFSFAQMTSNSDGKTSASGVMGILICSVGTLCFFLGCIDKMFLTKDIDVVTQSIIFVTIGVGLLGYRKSKAKPITSEETEILPKEPEIPSEEKLNN